MSTHVARVEFSDGVVETHATDSLADAQAFIERRGAELSAVILRDDVRPLAGWLRVAGLTIAGFEIVDMNYRLSCGMYRVTLRHDDGIGTTTTYARDMDTAIDIVCKAENAPRRAVVKVDALE